MSHDQIIRQLLLADRDESSDEDSDQELEDIIDDDITAAGDYREIEVITNTREDDEGVAADDEGTEQDESQTVATMRRTVTRRQLLSLVQAERMTVK